MKQDDGSQLEPLGAEEMRRVAGGDGWIDPPYQHWLATAYHWLATNLGPPPESSYAYGKVGYT